MMGQPPAKRGQPTGMARDLNLMKTDLSNTLVALRKQLADATGHPPGAVKLNRNKTLDRINTYDDPARQQDLKALSDGDLVKLTQQAIKARQQAMADGTWNPPAPEGLIEGASPAAPSPSIALPPAPPASPAGIAPAGPPALAAPAVAPSGPGQ